MPKSFPHIDPKNQMDPKTITQNMADYFNDTHEANLYRESELKKLILSI